MALTLEDYRRQVEANPENILCQFSLGQALFEAGHYKEAIGPLQLCAERKADWMMARILLGKCYLQLDQRPEARACLEQALNLAVEQQHEDPENEIRALLAGIEE